MAAKEYSVMKMGTRRGQPHYGADCKVCNSVLAIGHLSKESAHDVAKDHLNRMHGRNHSIPDRTKMSWE